MARYLVLVFFLFQNFYFMSGHALAAHPLAVENSQNGSDRLAFSDPHIKSPVSSDWAKPIAYDKKVSADVDLVISLGKQMYPLVKDYVEQYAKKNGLKIVLQSGSCGVTAKKLMKQQIDIGGYCCPPAYTDRLPGLEFHTIAIAPLVLITHPNNPVTNLSLSEARDIFQGAIRNWSDVEDIGETDNFAKKIQPIARLHCKVRPGHWRLLLQNEDLFSPELASVGVISDMISKVGKSKKM
ncbi:MAG: substrate-binding domain-containing protein, partial [Gammaproteobacteria bacterium]|nr:substrate-binding domain-containing protein [Gammaproteobacteria bacterium]